MYNCSLSSSYLELAYRALRSSRSLCYTRHKMENGMIKSKLIEYEAWGRL
jgi:hypothetical protein